jgi:hypothetical protein
MRAPASSSGLGLLVVVLGLLIASCTSDPPATGGDAGVDGAATVDGGGACIDFGGAYGFERGAACIGETELSLGTICVTQDDACHATIASSLGTIEGDVSGDALYFMLGALTCAARLDRAQLMLACEDGAGARCEASAATARSLAEQCCVSDAVCESGSRCAPVNLGLTAPVPIVSGCVRIGERAQGESCETGTSGIDDCEAGLTCTSGSLGADMLVCRPICHRATDCGAGETCRWYALTAPAVGYCVPACTVQGTECPDGATCDAATTIDAEGAIRNAVACRAIGAVATGEVCHLNSDCGDGHTCARSEAAGEARCWPTCDATHPCEDTALSCRYEGGAATGALGFCAPAT